MQGVLPADGCPFHRPFPAGFDGCPTYHEQIFVPLTSGFEVLPAVRSCQFLIEGEAGPGRFYGRCKLGTGEQRLEWLKQHDAERVARLNRFRQTLSEALGDRSEQLWTAKGRQLAARAAGSRHAEQEATEALALVATEIEATLDRFLEDNQETMEQLGLPMEQTRHLIRTLLDEMVRRTTVRTGGPYIPAAMLDQFPTEVRALFEPGPTAARNSG
jgi:hypothetical protein